MINKIIKVIKILLIVMIYVVLFWGLIKWITYPFTHKSKCERTCNCVVTEPTEEEIKVEETTAVIKEEVPKVEELKVKPKKEIKQEVKKTPKTNGNIYKEYAYDLVINEYLWSESDYDALVKLWTRESNWNPNAVNKSSGACNIPQALPCSKISNMYGDNSWESGIKWGLFYIKNRYGNPTAAWQHFKNKNWY